MEHGTARGNHLAHPPYAQIHTGARGIARSPRPRIGASHLADLIAASRRSRTVRQAITRDPRGYAQRAGYRLDDAEFAALDAVGPTVFGASDDELERRARRGRAAPLTGAGKVAAAALFAYRERVVDRTRAALAAADPPPALRDLFTRSLDGQLAWIRLAPCLPAVDFPAAIGGYGDAGLARAVPVSVAGLLYYLGISLVDDVIDDEVEVEWRGLSGAEVLLAGTCLFAGLPMQAMLGAWNGPLDVEAVLACHQALARARYDMALGQYLDIRTRLADDVTIADCTRIVALETGSTGELMARLTAAMIGHAPHEAEILAEACRDLYMAMQVASDIGDIWSRPLSTDLANGVVTLPTLYAFHCTPPGDRAGFAAELRSGDRSVAGHARLRQRITAAGGLAFAIVQAEALRQRALHARARLSATAVVGDLFDYMLDVARLVD